MVYENIRLETDGAVGSITIDRPEKMNALNRRTLEELLEALQILRNNPALRCLIITGAGEKAFVAGADISQITNLDQHTAEAFSRFGQNVFDAVEQFPLPVIAMVNGFALGGGCELAMACHLRLAADNARFGLPEINLGILPGYGGTQRLSRLVGMAPALQLMLTGDMIDADTALRLGLINAVYPQAELAAAAGKLAGKLAGKAPLAVRSILKAAYHSATSPLAEGQKIEATLFGEICQTADMKEGTSAFMEKRKPRFTGE